MATFFCTNCGERMCNSGNDNLFENYLVKTNVYYLEEKKYNEIELESVYKIDNSWKDKVKDNREKSCGCIILKDNKVLLIGARDDNGELFWSFPKGHQEDEVEKAEWVIIDEAGKYFNGYYSDAWGELLNRLNN